MHRRLIIGLLALAFSVFSVYAQDEVDIQGSTDYPLFTRIPGFYIAGYEVKDFDKYESNAPGDSVWEGKSTLITYSAKTGAKPLSMLQIALNYENALKKIGGKILVSANKAGRMMQGKIEKNGAVTYVEVAAFNEGTRYWLYIIEKGGMAQEVTADAASLKASIAATGKVVVEGIYFDADKATIKPESTAALEEIVKLLKQDAKLNLYVVGHTANSGTLDSCLKLSNDRAKAIVDALVAKGIAASRLKAVGVGPYSPAASNRTEEGKALNRRVELVEQ
jgi:OOP family OmpA-OmpF porin